MIILKLLLRRINSNMQRSYVVVTDLNYDVNFKKSYGSPIYLLLKTIV